MEREERLSRAEAFLQEAVYQSRARQAAGTFLAQAASGSERQCGLGERAEVVLDLTQRASELCGELWPAGIAADRVELVRDRMRQWVELQDALDRKRNHFLKAFRNEHGFDRNTYSPALLAEFERGLERVNAEVSTARRAAAEQLLG